MEDMVCASCHKGLSLEEIERGSFRHIGGRVYCADCVAKMRRVGPVLCTQCGTRDIPLYDGRTYACRKCGADLSAKPQAAQPKPAAAKQAHRPLKKCPYCGALLVAEALKCRYCGSLLTREAHELDIATQQNSRLRFWLGCLLSASVFLLIFVIYVLGHKSAQTIPASASVLPAAPEPAPTKAASDSAQELLQSLRKEVQSLHQQLAIVKAEQEAAARRERTPVVVPTRTTIPEVSPATKATEAPPKPPATPEANPSTTTAKAPTPPEKATPEGTTPVKTAAEPAKGGVPVPSGVEPRLTTPPPPTPKTPDTAKASAAEQAAATAYAAFEAKLKELKASRRYGEATALCRQFVGAYLGTAAANRAQADQNALRAELERIRDEHARLFREAVEKGDMDTARRVAAGLARYDAPETREDRDRMLAQLKASREGEAPAEPGASKVRDYLAQWEVPPNVARLLRDLSTEKESEPRARAIKELGRLGRREAIGPLIEVLRDPDWYVVAKTLNALEEIGDPIALPHIVPLTRASLPAIWDNAGKACRALADAPRDKFADAWKLVDTKNVASEIAETLKLTAKDESPVTARLQINLVEALALLDAKEAAPAIRAVLESKDPAVRKAASVAIKKLTGEDIPAGPPAKGAPEAKAPANAAPAPPPPAKTVAPLRTLPRLPAP